MAFYSIRLGLETETDHAESPFNQRQGGKGVKVEIRIIIYMAVLDLRIVIHHINLAPNHGDGIAVPVKMLAI